MKVKCPTCQNEVEWKPENKYKPFCSERCRLIDLGEWASESHVIKGESFNQQLTPQIDEFSEDLPPADEDFFKH
ncbi:DNA gyrase inhibitor YacG [Catenovulum sp. 2E275]|uniref:DNA gyrase inhibitor YacG n=1 Tax=Catenovulum sp. 2E275 TaxID=2980497 RepID=UPI0021D0139C|nr:DNA gyrase inhibitor YacG [Catenovulum sp. 2E275]MCU4674354.1 DNA gyrase inhibitor YacG [Catenovulum sp. 2E275]